jgi:hypothetical protein
MARGKHRRIVLLVRETNDYGKSKPSLYFFDAFAKTTRSDAKPVAACCYMQVQQPAITADTATAQQRKLQQQPDSASYYFLVMLQLAGTAVFEEKALLQHSKVVDFTQLADHALNRTSQWGMVTAQQMLQYAASMTVRVGAQPGADVVSVKGSTQSVDMPAAAAAAAQAIASSAAASSDTSTASVSSSNSSSSSTCDSYSSQQQQMQVCYPTTVSTPFELPVLLAALVRARSAVAHAGCCSRASWAVS